MNIIETNFEFSNLSQRPITDMIVIHHTGVGYDCDPSAASIHQSHLANGWAGIGYHFVIRKNGDVEIGRPEWAVGSHAGGENSHTIGIHLSGDFDAAYPTEAQLNACAELVADLCHDYAIPLDRNYIVGHCDLMPTGCPGQNLYARLDDIIARANGLDTTNVVGTPVTTIYDLAERYESGGNPAIIGGGYGLFQFVGATVTNFVNWLKKYPDDKLANYGRYLSENDFDTAWTELGNVDPGHFGDLQREFAFEYFYKPAAATFAKNYFHVENHSLTMQAVVFARAIQHGVNGAVNLFNNACTYPNLSYVDDINFDRELIADAYDYLSVTRPDLKTRWTREKADALA